MKEGFEMTDMGFLRYFLGIEVDQNEKGIFISQARYVNQVLSRFNMEECKAAITPTVMRLKLSREDSSKDFDPSLYKSIVGSLMYLTATRLDIMYVVNLISRFMERPKEAHWQAAKRILRYVKVIRLEVLMIGRALPVMFSIWGSGAISWASKKQSIVALSTAEAEYVAYSSSMSSSLMRRM
eukprot:PITA_03658